MSEFRKLVETILKNNGYDLKEWDEDDYDYDEYHSNPDDHTIEGEEIEWTIDLPMNDNIRKEILRSNLVGEEDLKDGTGNWLPTSEFDVIIEYNIDGYPDDEEITVTNIYLVDLDENNHYEKFKGAKLTPFLPEGYLDEVATELENKSDIELHSYDYEKQVRDDYYSMIAPGGKL